MPTLMQLSSGTRMTPAATKKGRPTAEDSQHKLARVVSVAREQFSLVGYRAVTMRGVAEGAQVSTRTLYNRYADKLSLFAACLEVGAEAAFPHLEHSSRTDVRKVLEEHANAVVRVLSEDSTLRLSMLVYREGGEFPEVVRAAEANQERHLVRPLASYLRKVGLESRGGSERAKLFLAMAISEWQRRVTFHRPLPSAEERVRHAQLVVSVFLEGAKVAAQSPEQISD